MFPPDILDPPRVLLELSTNLVHLNRMDRGGHFAPVEEPELYVGELRDFFRPFR